MAVLALGAFGCAAVPMPTLLTELDGVRAGPAAAEARRYAPDALAHADKIAVEADAAFKSRDIAGSQFLAEQAIAAYAHAHAIARRARAEAEASQSASTLAASEAELATLDGDQARAAAEADALETKLKVSRDALPITPSGKADPERERARAAAARALAMQARLLCGAARLLVSSSPAAPVGTGPGAPPKSDLGLSDAEAALTKVEEELASGGLAAPIDGATRARAGCLAALTLVRRAHTTAARASGVSDALLAELSAVGKLDPARDDRGVTVTLRGVFGGGGANLTPAAEAKLGALGRVAAAHASFPVEIVVHSDRPVTAREEPAEKARAEAAMRALLKTAGAGVQALPLVAGNRTPVADPRGPDRARNARVEVVFVTPETF